jgi:hypothetical protein
VRRYFKVVLVVAVVFSLRTRAVIAADVTSTYLGGSGNWSDPARWSSNPAYPNNGALTYDAVVNPITNVTIMLTEPITINKLDLALATVTGNFDLT